MPSFRPGLNWLSLSSEREHNEARPTKKRRGALSEPTMDVNGDEGDVITRSQPDTSPIYFYNRGKPFFEFTNFSLHSIEYEGKIYATAEHLFQAFKFMKTDPAIAELIRTRHSARAARSEAGFQRSRQRPDWFDVNVEVMDTVLSAKFTQHEDLRRTLLETANRELIEDSPDDVFWGIGRDGQGRNELGKALMRLRGQLRECVRCSPSRSQPSSVQSRSPDPSPGTNDVVSPP